MVDLLEFLVVTEGSESYLNQHQLLDYRNQREAWLYLLLTFGNEPDEAVGYANGTVKPRCYRMDRFYRFVWELNDAYTANITFDHADT